MSASSKFDLSSGSPDRPLYGSGQRGSYTAASMDRSSSFRENMENPILSSLPSMSRSTSNVTQGDVMSFFQCLRFDPKVMVTDHKLNRQSDFKRLASVALGVSQEDSSSGSSKGKLPSHSLEELRRLKAGLHECIIKGRERVKIFSEGLSAINKCFPSIPSRKRSRSDVLSGDRSNALFPSDRSVFGAGASKMGAQGHSVASGYELDQQRSEERTKSAIPNKRTRTSMVDPRNDVRASTPARSSGSVERDKEMLRIPSSNTIQGEDRTLPIGVDGWEKSKMKKKRSGIKVDVAPSTITTKPIDGYREAKQGMQARSLSDARSRLGDSYGFRQGASNGVGKADGTLQQTSSGVRSSISVSRADQDNNSVVHDRRDRTIGSDKERVNLRAVNKTNVREEFSSASPTSSAKLNATTRAPRSGSSVVPKLSPVVQRATAANDWELPHCTSKSTASVGASNRKSTPSTRSSSPPVTQWAGHRQRPQKMSRTAKRTNFVPIVSNNDETPASDTVSDVTGNDNNGSGFARRLSSNSPQQVKLKSEHFLSAALSESEESVVAAEIKLRDKCKNSDEINEKTGQNVQKVVLPPKKNKVVSGEKIGDGIRRQGRTGRGTRSLVPMRAEKLGNAGTAKQLRSAKLGFDKNESKAGRPPTRKLSDRKAYTRQKHNTINAAADFLVGSDDGHEELLAAANAVINPNHAFSSSFWRQMERLFGFISDVDISYLKQQANLGTAMATPNTQPFNVDDSSSIATGFRLIEKGRDVIKTKTAEFSPQHLAPGTGGLSEIPLCQRLLCALISEDGNEEPCCSGSEDLRYDVYGSEIEIDTDMESVAFNHRSFQSFGLAEHTSFNGYSFDHSQNGSLSDQSMLPGIACYEFQYDTMSINERLLLEIHSIGLYPEPVPDLTQTYEEEISGDISRLEEKYHEQASRKKSLLDKLLKSASETRELQEKEFEQRALDKLLGMAYQKYMSCWGPNAHGGKSASFKLAKQAALAFVKRTLERCQEFKETGKSCFSEPLFREMFLSGTSHLNDAQTVDASTDGESGKLYLNTPSCSMEARVAAPLGTHQSPSLNNHDIYSSDMLLSANHLSDQAIGKEDTWSNKVKKRELLLDEVISGTVGTSSGMGTSLTSSAKGKRSERDREGKGNTREVISRNGTAKIGRPASGNVKGERKYKTKPKQKMTQLSASVNGPLGKISDQPKSTLSPMPNSGEMTTSGSGKEEFSLDVLNNPEDIDFSNLQMDVLDVPDDLDGQGQDIGSWLNIDDDGLQDHDFMGLEIPMDDLSDLNMMV